MPEISWPKAKLKFEGDDLKALEDNISVRRTIFLLVFGISIPTYDLPSITSTTLTLLTDNDLAISWAIFVILLALVPGAGWISNLVTTGPGNTDSTVASMPNSKSLVSNNDAIWFNSASDNELPSSSALSSNSVLGMTLFSFLISELSELSGFETSLRGIFGSIGKSACFKSFLSSCDGFLLNSDSAEILDFEDFTFLTFEESCIVLTIFFELAKIELIIFFILTKKFLNTLKPYLKILINNFPNWSNFSSQEKLKEKEVVGINRTTKKISDPTFPNKEVKAFKTITPIAPPKSSVIYSCPTEQKHTIKKIELINLTRILVSELFGSS